MKKPIFGIVLLCLRALAAWQPDEFIIGAYHEPAFTGNRNDDSSTFRNYKNLGFSVLSGYVVNKVQDPWNTGYIFFYNRSFAHSIDAVYRLDVLTRIPGLRTFIWERGITAGADEALKTARLFASIPSKSAPPYTQPLRNKMFGYTGYRDEAPSSAVVRDVLPIIRAVHDGDPAKPSCPNFSCGLAPWENGISGDDRARFKGNMDTFRANLAAYLDDTAVSLFSFDYYKFFWYHSPSGKRKGPVTGGSPYHTFYGHLQILAEETRRTNKAYYGVPCCANHEVEEYSRKNTAGQWSLLYVRKFLNPANAKSPVTEAFLRHEAYSYVLYGARGLLWFSYLTPSQTEIVPWRDPPFNSLIGSKEMYIDQPSNNADIRTAMQKINREISRLGPVVLQLRWAGVGHGAATDPELSEPYLPLLSAGLAPFSQSASRAPVEAGAGAKGWKADSLAIGVFTKSNVYYLAVMNKSLVNPNRSKFNCTGKFTPRMFDKEKGEWKALGRAAYDAEHNVTSFELDLPLAPGDLQLVRLDPK
jgi:hypothetical protein